MPDLDQGAASAARLFPLTIAFADGAVATLHADGSITGELEVTRAALQAMPEPPDGSAGLMGLLYWLLLRALPGAPAACRPPPPLPPGPLEELPREGEGRAGSFDLVSVIGGKIALD